MLSAIFFNGRGWSLDDVAPVGLFRPGSSGLAPVVLTLFFANVELVGDVGSVETKGSLPNSPSGLVTKLPGLERSSPAVFRPAFSTVLH